MASPVVAEATQTQAPTEEAVVEVVQADAKDVEIERLQQEVRTLKGSQSVRLQGPDVLNALNEIKDESRKMRRQLLDVDMSDEQRREELAQLTVAEREAEGKVELAQISLELAQDVSDDLEEAGISIDRPDVQDILKRWDEATTLRERQRLNREIHKLTRAEERKVDKAAVAAAEKDRDDTRKQYNTEENPLATGSSAGTPASGTMSWDQAQKAKNVKDISDEAYAKLTA